jgi:DNA invertase Pin-like site-specific DNA recombinase
MLRIAVRGDLIIATKLDRMFRRAADALATRQDLDSRGVDLVLLDLSSEPLRTSPIGTLMLTMMSAVSEFERNTIRERIASVKADQKMQGLYLGGRVPAGCAVQDGRLVRVDLHSEMVARGREMQAAGAGLRAIAADFERRGWPITSASGVRRVLLGLTGPQLPGSEPPAATVR